jgi:molecular chaperone GrpE
MDEGKEPRPNDSKEPRVRVVDRRWWARGAAADAGEEIGARKPTYVEELEQQIAEHKERLQEFMNEHRRSLDEFEQVKGRIRRDVAREVERGRRVVLVELLDVLDNLDRAVAAAREPSAQAGSDGASQLVRGVELVRDQFLAKLESFGVGRMPALGAPFDAARHEAVTTLPVDASGDGIIVAVIKEGYAIGDEVLRPASVVVGRHQDQS